MAQESRDKNNRGAFFFMGSLWHAGPSELGEDLWGPFSHLARH